jgi:hypothetical protein
MLKRIDIHQARMAPQPDHSQIADRFAAHWGNDHFTHLGTYLPSPETEKLRSETIFAIVNRQNGWWK